MRVSVPAPRSRLVAGFPCFAPSLMAWSGPRQRPAVPETPHSTEKGSRPHVASGQAVCRRQARAKRGTQRSGGARRGSTEVPAAQPHKSPGPHVPALQTHPFSSSHRGSLNTVVGCPAEPAGRWGTAQGPRGCHLCHARFPGHFLMYSYYTERCRPTPTPGTSRTRAGGGRRAAPGGQGGLTETLPEQEFPRHKPAPCNFRP